MYHQSQIIVKSDSGVGLSMEELKNILNLDTKIEISNHNLKSIQLTEDKSSIGIKEIEFLNEWAYTRSENLKIAVVYSAEKMTREAQNAILKVLEEPGSNTLIVLITKNENSLLNTVRSRCKIVKTGDFLKDTEISEFSEWFVSKHNNIPSFKEFNKKINDLPTNDLQKIIEDIRNKIIEKYRAEEGIRDIENMIELLEIVELGVQNRISEKAIISTLHSFLANQNL